MPKDVAESGTELGGYGICPLSFADERYHPKFIFRFRTSHKLIIFALQPTVSKPHRLGSVSRSAHEHRDFSMGDLSVQAIPEVLPGLHEPIVERDIDSVIVEPLGEFSHLCFVVF